jgi:hypothetical protein
VVLLVMEAAFFCGVAHSVTHQVRTPAGDRALNYLRHSFESLRQRTRSMAHPAAADVAVVAAVFGLAGLEHVSFAKVKVLQPRSGGAGCGGGCGSGCGDGCGGCD